jgi:transcriptional regulator with XRE-family HTH domain
VNDLVKRARKRAGLSQRALARRAHVPQATVARIESGVVDPHLSTVTNLLQACGYRLALSRLGEGVDRTLILRRLELTPDELLDLAASDAAGLDDLLSSITR